MIIIDSAGSVLDIYISIVVTWDIFTIWYDSHFLMNVNNVHKNRDKYSTTVLMAGNILTETKIKCKY